MDKPAEVILQFDKSTQGFWSGFVEVVDKKTVREVGNTVIALIPVKSYSLADHQFIQLKVNMGGGKEMVVLIPRGVVVAIVEGKIGLENTGFYSSASAKK